MGQAAGWAHLHHAAEAGCAGEAAPLQGRGGLLGPRLDGGLEERKEVHGVGEPVGERGQLAVGLDEPPMVCTMRSKMLVRSASRERQCTSDLYSTHASTGRPLSTPGAPPCTGAGPPGLAVSCRRHTTGTPQVTGHLC